MDSRGLMHCISISVCIITLGRPSIYKTLRTIFAQSLEASFEVVIILQGTLDCGIIAALNQQGVPVTIYHYDSGLGFAYYRNEAIKRSRGEIVVFIDDDEWTSDDRWLLSLTRPILEGQYLVATAGYRVELTGHYLTDCISYLGYPGGGSLGFEKMWLVDSNGHTNHLCTGNFALANKINIRFDQALVHGAEDAQFSQALHAAGIEIKYLREATVFHQPRSGLLLFIHWHIRRGKSAYEYKKLGFMSETDLRNRIRATKNIISNTFFTRYIFGVLFLLVLQYGATLAGYIFRAKQKSP